jgi:hypothetical protein
VFSSLKGIFCSQLAIIPIEDLAKQKFLKKKKKTHWDSFLTVTPPGASLKKLNVGVQ